MTQFITEAEIKSLAFTDGEYIADGCISQCDIRSVVERWVVPVVGRAVIEAVEGGKYEELKEEYLKPVVALYTRLEVQPRLNASTSQMGLSVAATSSRRAASDKAREELRRSLKQRAHQLRLRLSDYLEEHQTEIAEYDRKHNILNRCRCDGGFIQIR